jgi:subtilisin family serine protease
MSFSHTIQHCISDRRKLILNLAARLVVAVFAFAFVVSAQFGPKPYADGELLIKLKAGETRDSVAELTLRMGALVVEKLGDTGWMRMKLPDNMTVKMAEAKFGSLPFVEAAQPNFYYQLQVTPDDTRFSELWGMSKISAPAAWDVETGSSTTIVAVIDTGIKYTHPDLAANLWTNSGEKPGNGIDDDDNGFVDDYYGYDFFFDDPDPNDEHGHGTHVAGTIGALGNNALGVVGVNWNVRLMAVKIYDSTGFGTTSAMLINAYNYVRSMRERGENIRVTNNSYGDCTEACDYDQATRDALEALGNAGVLNVFAAGNDARNVDSAPSYPASYDLPTIVSVASSTSTDTRSGFSNFGPISVDLAAPGSSILSTVMTSGEYGMKSGTSMASPHVAGAAALLSSHDPGLSNLSLKATLMNSVDKLAAWTSLVGSGGRLNAAAALGSETVCTYSLSAKSIAAPTKGGFFTVNVNAPENCGFSVRSLDRWIIPMSEKDFRGPGEVRFRVTVNPTVTRSGTIRIAGTDVPVTQSRL